MSDYRRRYVPGGTYFFTVVTNQRRQLFGVERNFRLLGDKMRAVCCELPFQTVAAVLMPDHLHVLWTLPRGDTDYSTRWQRIKREFTYAYLAAGGRECCVSLSNRRHRNRGVWQRRFWEHTLRDESEFIDFCDYIHFNPVKHGYVRRVADWPYSTFHRFVAAGEYAANWGKAVPKTIANLDYEYLE